MSLQGYGMPSRKGTVANMINKQLWKRMGAALLTACLLVSLTACGNNEPPQSQQGDRTTTTTESEASADSTTDTGESTDGTTGEDGSTTAGQSGTDGSRPGSNNSKPGSKPGSSNNSKPGSSNNSKPGSKPVTTTTTTVAATTTTTAKPTIPVMDKSNFAGMCPAYDGNSPDLLNEAQWKHYEQLGIKTLRVEFVLKYAGKKISTIDFSKYDALVKRAQKMGIDVVMLVDYDSYESTPQRTSSNTVEYNHVDPDGKVDCMKLLDAMEVIGPHFAKLGVHSWEIWNEQNAGWMINQENYAKIISTIYENFKYTKKWDTKAIISFGGLDSVIVNSQPSNGVNNGTLNWFKGIYQTKAYKAFKAKYGRSPWDALSIHPYGAVQLYKDKIIYNKNKKGIETYYDVLKANGDEKCEIWLTEVGDQNGNPEYNALAMKAFLESAYDAGPCTRFFYFKYLYQSAESAGNYSIIDVHTREPKPAFDMYKNFIASKK